MSRCGNNDCQYHKYCEGGLMWYDEDISNCRYWVEPKPATMKRIEIAETDYDKVVKILNKNKIEFK